MEVRKSGVGFDGSPTFEVKIDEHVCMPLCALTHHIYNETYTYRYEFLKVTRDENTIIASSDGSWIISSSSSSSSRTIGKVSLITLTGQSAGTYSERVTAAW